MAGRDGLRPALELAVDVARASAPGDVPHGLRPYLRFRQLPGAACTAVRNIVDRDEAFRTRVAALADEAELGRVGWIFLVRPDGWQEELAALTGSLGHDAAGDDHTLEEAVTELERRLARERSARREADSLRAKAEHALGEVREHVERLERELADATEQLDAVRADRADAVRRLKESEARAVEAATDRNALRRELRLRTDERDDARGALDALRSAGGSAGERPGGSGSAVAPGTPPAPRAPAGWDPEATAALGAAAAGAAQLADALGALARNVGGEDAPAAPRVRPPAPARRAASAGAPRRHPPTLPGGVHEESPEAALCALRSPRSVLVVDGYNVSKTAWPELPLPEQRSRLVDVLAEVAARTGVDVELVFDGAAAVASPMPAVPLGVRVRFSREGVTADDEILDLVDALPASRPVVVASSDGEVRDGARRRGAMPIHASQLLAAANR